MYSHFWFVSTGRAMAPAVSRRPRRNGGPGSIPDQFRVRFVMDKVTMGQVYFFFSPTFVSIIQPVLRTDYLHGVYTRRANGRNLGTFQKQCSFQLDTNVP